MRPVTLQLAEAIDLGHAWVQSLAKRRSIRALFLKGPALHRQGLRDERGSSDVDVLVEPDRFDDLCDAILAAGWRERPSILIWERTTLHSRSFISDSWPCDIDVHRSFPGFLAEPADAFDALWARRVGMDFAHRECLIPDRVGGLLVLALHSLRGSAGQARHAAELEQLLAVSLTEAEKMDASALATATGSAATLETVLPLLGIDVRPSPAELASPNLRLWRERVDSGSHGAYMWMLAFRTARWSERPRIVARALWPSRHDLLVAHPDMTDDAVGRVRARAARLARGFRSLPRSVRAIVAHRRPRANPRADPTGRRAPE